MSEDGWDSEGVEKEEPEDGDWTPSWMQEAVWDLGVYWMNFKIRRIDPITTPIINWIKDYRLNKLLKKMEQVRR